MYALVHMHARTRIHSDIGVIPHLYNQSYNAKRRLYALEHIQI